MSEEAKVKVKRARKAKPAAKRTRRAAAKPKAKRAYKKRATARAGTPKRKYTKRKSLGRSLDSLLEQAAIKGARDAMAEVMRSLRA